MGGGADSIENYFSKICLHVGNPMLTIFGHSTNRDALINPQARV